MEILIYLAIFVAVLNNLAVQVWLLAALRRERLAAAPAAPFVDMTPEELEERRKAAEAQAKFEQGFVNLMSYDGMPAKKREGVFG